MSSLVTKAIYFAIAAHEAVKQKRKYTNEPYWKHPERVAGLVALNGGSDEQIAAAWLHDTVEDTGVTIETIETLFGEEVANLVSDLTDVSKPEDGNRATRKAIDCAHTALASSEAKTIKLADLIDNTACIIEHDVNFAKIYLKEKEIMMKVLTQGDPALYAQAQAQMRLAMAKIN